MRVFLSGTEKIVDLDIKNITMRTETVTFENYTFKIKVDPDMPDYSKDPYFVKKLAEMDAFMKMNPLPEMNKKG